MNEAKGTALITGASSGIGALYADRLARQGYDLILVARNAAKLDQVAETIRAATGQKVDVLAADLAKAGDLRLIEARLANDRGITLLANNAGIGSTARALDADVDTMSSIVALNVEALMRLTYAVVPAFVRAAAAPSSTSPRSWRSLPRCERRLRRQQGLRPRLQPEPAPRTRKHRGPRTGRPAPARLRPISGMSRAHRSSIFPARLSCVPTNWSMQRLRASRAASSQRSPSLHNQSRWDAFEAARQAMAGELSTSTPAVRYLAA